VTDIPDVTFAGFSEDEWVAAHALMVGNDAARRQVQPMFASIRANGSNIELISDVSWALLALVNADCAQRVQNRLASFPSGFRDRVLRLIESYRSMVDGDVLRTAYENGLAEWNATHGSD
jgi:hypothetical protein